MALRGNKVHFTEWTADAVWVFWTN